MSKPVDTNPEVTAAMNALYRTAADTFYIENVDNASNIVYKALAWIGHKFVWVHHKVWRTDTTIDQFKEKTCALIHAIGKRELTGKELGILGRAGQLNGGPINTPENIGKQQAAEKDADAAVDKFYEAFKERCTTIGITASSKEFNVYVQAAKKAAETSIQEECTKLSAGQKSYMIDKFNRREADLFGEKIVKASIEDFAAKPLSEINSDTQQALVDSLMKTCPNNTVNDLWAAVTAQIIKGLDGNKDKIAAFKKEATKLATEYGKVGKGSKVEGLENAEKAKGNAVVAEYQPKWRAIVGWENEKISDKGTLNTAWNAMKDAEKKANVKSEVFVAKFQELFGTANANPTLDDVAGIDITDPVLKTAHTELKTAVETLKNATKTHDDLKAELAEIAQWNNNSSSINGGKVETEGYAVVRGAPLKAQATAALYVQFYNHLAASAV